MFTTRILAAGMALGLASITGNAMAQVQSHRLSGNQISINSVDEVLMGEHVRLENFDTPMGLLDLELDRIDVLTDDAQLVLGTAEGIVDLPEPELVVLRGIVAGDAESLAYIAISPYGTNGFIRQNDELVSISTGPYAQGKDLAQALRTAKMSDVVDPDADNRPQDACGYTAGDRRLEPMGLPVVDVSKNQSVNRGATTCRIATIAVETDWEFTDRLFNGNTNAAASYLVSLVGALSEIYERDFDVRLAIPYLRVWDADVDPYTTTTDPLDQVRDHWNANLTDVDRTITHYFTGRQNTSYGGVAYVGVLCFNQYGYGVSAYLDGFFPYPLIDYSHANWDVIVSGHEVGHNFGTGHTHSAYSPTIDDCGNNDCSSPFGGTIMSYCHTCPGGLSNIQLNFHPRVIEYVLGYLDQVNCDLISVGVTAANDFVSTLEDTSADFDLLGNDTAQSCDPFVFNGVDSFSANGGTIERLIGQGTAGRDLFRYTPALGFTGDDTFQYTILGDQGVQSATVNINVRALRPADERLNPIAGLRLSYYELMNPSELPDFDTLDPIKDEVSDSISYPSTTGAFINSGLFDNVGAVFEGYVWALIDGEYTFFTESDDGSKLFIGDELVVDNDGLHGMVKRGGVIPLRSGWHNVRIEFFEAGGGAGLYATMSGPGMAEQGLSGLFLSHEANIPCTLADLNADQELDFFDVSIFLTAFSQNDLDVDLNDDGVLDFFDVSAFLVSYEAGCP